VCDVVNVGSSVEGVVGRYFAGVEDQLAVDTESVAQSDDRAALEQ